MTRERLGTTLAAAGLAAVVLVTALLGGWLGLGRSAVDGLFGVSLPPWAQGVVVLGSGEEAGTPGADPGDPGDPPAAPGANATPETPETPALGGAFAAPTSPGPPGAGAETGAAPLAPPGDPQPGPPDPGEPDGQLVGDTVTSVVELTGDTLSGVASTGGDILDTGLGLLAAPARSSSSDPDA